MGDFRAGSLAIGVLIYFIVLGALFTFAYNISEYYDLEFTQHNGVASLSPNINTATFGFCDTPRYFLTPDGLETQKGSSWLQCGWLPVAVSQGGCIQVEGCSWENVTDGFWLWKTTTQQCVGYINDTYYNNNQTWGTTFYRPSLCKLPQARDDTTICENLGCTWNDEDGSDVGFATTLDLFKGLFSFNVSFGFEDEYFNDLIVLIILYLPLTILAVCIYFMLPFVH